jgi:hypothetical protein
LNPLSRHVFLHTVRVRWKLLLWFLLAQPLAAAEVFRISKVHAEATAETREFKLGKGEDLELLHVGNEPILTSADVESVRRSVVQENTLDFKVTEAGARKLSKATELGAGQLRLAILIDDEVMSAPTVNTQLGGAFCVSGLDELEEDLEFLAMRIEGRSDEEIQKFLLARENAAPPAPKPEMPAEKDRRRLQAEMPDFEMDGERGVIRWIEGIQLTLKAGETEPHPQDYADLLSLIHSAAELAEGADLIEANCSVVKTLADRFPEVRALGEKTDNGQIKLLDLRDVLKPYLFGEKEFPK